MAVLAVLIGTRGAGKSTTLEFLREKGVFVLKPSTDRPPRGSNDTEYYFERNWSEVELEWDIVVGSHKYGMRRSEIDEVIRRGLGVTVFEPGSFEALQDFKRSGRVEVVSLGLDTVETVEEQAERTGSDGTRQVSRQKLVTDREVVQRCDAIFSGDEKVVGEAAFAACRILGSRGGVLDGGAVRALLRAGTLLADAKEDNVQSASYDLRLGVQAWCQGKFVFLDKKNPTLKIPAYSYAIVTTQEEARIPRFLTGRYDLTVSGFMDGLVLSNGPQVDPGYRGSLFCTLFNGRDVARGVTLGRHLATIEFVTSTGVTDGYSGGYQGKKDLSAFVSENTAVSPGGNIVERIDNLERSIDDKVAPVRQFWLSSVGIVILIHLTVAGWLWLGGPNLAEWITGCVSQAVQGEGDSDAGAEESGGRSGTNLGEKKGKSAVRARTGSSSEKAVRK